MIQIKKPSGTFILKDNTRHQLIYSSQLYGTHFNIFASLESEDVTGTNKVAIKGGYFYLVNYKGPINMGIVSIAQPVLYKDRFLAIRITVRGMSEAKLEQSFYPFPDGPIEISKRALDDSEPNYLVISRNLRWLDGSGGSNAPSLFEKNVFESEYYSREGIHGMGTSPYVTRNRVKEPTIEEIITDLENKTKENSDFDFDAAFIAITGGFRCMYSASLLIVS